MESLVETSACLENLEMKREKKNPSRAGKPVVDPGECLYLDFKGACDSQAGGRAFLKGEQHWLKTGITRLSLQWFSFRLHENYCLWHYSR